MPRQRDRRRDCITIADTWRWRGRRGIGKRYLARVRDERLHAYKARSFANKADAVGWAKEQRHLLALGETTAARFDLGPIGRDLLDRMGRDGKGPQYIRAMTLAISAMQAVGVRDLGADGFQAQIRAYITSDTNEDKRRNQAGDARPAPRTMRVRYGYVRAIVRHAMNTFRMRTDPLIGFAMPGGASLREIDRDGGGEAYTIAEVRQVLALDQPNEPAWLAFTIGVYAGLRAAEIRDLHWQDIDFTNRTIRVTCGKGRKVRVIALQPELAEILSGAGGRDGGKVAKIGAVVRLAEPRLHTQHHLEPLLLAARVDRNRGVNEVTGLPRNLGWHSCRRTFAAACLASGMDGMELGRQLGHTVNEQNLTAGYAASFQTMKATIGDECWPRGQLCFIDGKMKVLANQQ